jgi:hypothetical protein
MNISGRENRMAKAMRSWSMWAWWSTPINPALRKQRQEDHKFKTSLDYTVRSSLFVCFFKKGNQAEHLLRGEWVPSE